MGLRVTSNFDVYPPERGEIGQSLPKLARFYLGPIQTGGSLSDDVFTSTLYSDSRSKPLKPRYEPQFFFIFAI